MDQKSKIRINLQNAAIEGEELWAERIGEDIFRLLNVPFYATGYAEGDIVRCVAQGGWNEVIEVVRESGNGTLRLMFTDSESSDAERVLNELSSVGCTYERASKQFVGITVPPTLDVPFSQLVNYLNSLPTKILVGWEIGKRFTRPVS